MFSSYSKSKTSDKAGLEKLICSSAPLLATLPELQFEKGVGLFLGEEQVREQGRVQPWPNPVQPDLI